MQPAEANDTPAAKLDAAAEPARPGKWLRTLVWVFESFGPLIVFVAFEHLVGLFAAIISGIVTAAILVASQIIRERKISPFTAFIAASVVGFGVLDLHYQTGFFVKIEPALGNVMTGLFFLGTVVLGRPLILDSPKNSSAESSPKKRMAICAIGPSSGASFFSCAPRSTSGWHSG